MYNIDWEIQLGRYMLTLLASAEVINSVELLADTCVIELPTGAYNKVFEIESKLKRGDHVVVKTGYNSDLEEKFRGYILNITTDDGILKINCEDDLFLLRKPVKDKKFRSVSVKELAQYVAGETGSGLTVECSLSLSYESFVISQASGYDVLKKIQEETGGNIYIRDGALHIHPKYQESEGEVVFSFQTNIESADLKYIKADDRKIEIKVTSTGKDGQIIEERYGTTGGEVVELKGLGLDKASMKARAKMEYSLAMLDGYEGDITGWLLPVARPTMTLRIEDEDYPWKNGDYYITAVTTMISENGGVQKISIGKKLA